MTFYDWAFVANAVTGLFIAIGFALAGKWWNTGVWVQYAGANFCWIMAQRTYG
jgi:hypothetical protein